MNCPICTPNEVGRICDSCAKEMADQAVELGRLRAELQQTEEARRVLWAKLAMVLDWNGTKRIPADFVDFFAPEKCELHEWREGTDYMFRVKTKVSGRT